MGSPVYENGRDNDETQCPVRLTKGFWLGETEVTQGFWRKVMGNNPSGFKSGDEYPVERVSWYDCREFLKELNAKAPVAGFLWTLPTEAQWEYACRAGTSGAFAARGHLDDMGWYSDNSGFSTHPVGQKEANAWGFRDMHGNVWEWCRDSWDGNYLMSEAQTDPIGLTGADRIYRGGSWSYSARYCRSAFRYYTDPGLPNDDLGLRVALVPVASRMNEP